jgi:hypothetical protein
MTTTATPPDPNQTLLHLRDALAALRQLAEQPSADPFFQQAAEQVAAIVAGLESRASPTENLLPAPPSPG